MRAPRLSQLSWIVTAAKHTKCQPENVKANIDINPQMQSHSHSSIHTTAYLSSVNRGRQSAGLVQAPDYTPLPVAMQALTKQMRQYVNSC